LARVAVAVGMLGAALAWAGTGSSKAGEYDVWSCKGPAGQVLSAAAWRVQYSDAELGDVYKTDDCLTGGPVGLHVNDLGVPPNRKARIDLVFDLPRDEIISEYRMTRSIRTAAAPVGSNYAAAIREIQGGIAYDQGCASVLALPSFDCGSVGDHSDPDDPGNLVSRSGLGLNGLSTWAACQTSGCAPPVTAPAAEFNLFSSVVTVVDNDPPDVTGIGGSLSRPVPVSGLADLFIEAADTNAGIRALYLDIDGVPTQSITIDTSATCAEPFEVARPCPAETGRIFSVNTDPLSEGPHSATGQVVDAAGNSTPFGPVPFTVAHPGPPAPDNGIPAVEDPVLRLDRKLVEHSPGAPARVGGTLTTSTGQPISGASLGVVSTSLGGRESIDRPGDPVVTDAQGRFLSLDKGSGARRLAFSYSPFVGGAVAGSVTATVRSRLKVGLKANPRRVRIGRTVKFAGRISGGGDSVRGADVEIQAIADGRWQTVANATGRANGTFSWKYRFRHVKRDALFSFRALIRATPGWPWPTVTSKRIKVRIKVPGT